MRAIAFTGAVLLACLTPALAQLPQSTIDACWTAATPAEARIGYCTRVIASGELEANDMAGAFIARGNAHSSLKQYDRAIADYDQAIALNPGLAVAYSNRGLAYADKQQYDRAIADYDQAIAVNPDYTRAYYGRGRAHADKRQFDRAIADFDQAIKLDPRYAAAYHQRGLALTMTRQYERARADYNLAIELEPDNARRYNGRCWGLAIAGKALDQALADCNTAIRLAPNTREYLDSRGLVHFKAGRLSAAEQDYSAAIALKADYAHSLFGRGVARLRQGNTAGNADLAAARKLDGKIDATYAAFGIKP